MYFFDLIEIELSGQDHSSDTSIFQEFYVFGIPIVGLSTCVQYDRRQVHLEYGHILDYQSIDADIVQVIDQFPTSFEFIVVQYRIDHHKNLSLKQVCIPHHFGDIIEGIGRIGACAKEWCTYIDSVCTCIDGSYALYQVFGRSKDFDFLFHELN